MKKVLAPAAVLLLSCALSTAALPATAATPGTAPVSTPALTGDVLRAGSGQVSVSGIRDEFAKLRCLFFRC